MHHGKDLPIISPEDTFKDLLFTITSKKLGIGIVVNADNDLLGIISDGDLRRACNRGPVVFEQQASNIMTRNPKTIPADILAYKALEIMEAFNITSLIVTEEQKVIGLLHIHDLIKAGIRGE
jgi:arabinose-5-phosphate isomerase